MTNEEAEELNRPLTLRQRRINERGNFAWEWIGIVVAALLAALLIRTFALQTFWIPSQSMETTLLVHDHVLVNKIVYEMGDIKRGDIVVFERPPTAESSDIKDLIKRVIGVPGDTVEGREGRVYLNGELLSEPYLDPGTITTNLPLTTVPEGHYFMMGDNRTNSADSRTSLGPISKDLVVGRADIRIWPLGRFGGL